MIDQKEQDNYLHKGLRKTLVAELAQKGITDVNVLNAIGTVPRHLFFGDDTVFHETRAYADEAFPIGEGQTISQPRTVAIQSTLLRVNPKDKILEIGTGSGYQAAVLDTLGAKIYSIERHRKLYQRTKALLQRLGYTNVKCFFGDGFEGLPAYAPFDKIVITAAVSDFPAVLLRQLAIGGQMIMPYGSATNCKMLRITRQSKDHYSEELFDDFKFVPMLKGKVFENRNINL